jgi:hypothetical protein
MPEWRGIVVHSYVAPSPLSPNIALVVSGNAMLKNGPAALCKG